MKVGDKFTMPITVRRKWWQLWKPRTMETVQSFTVVGSTVGRSVEDILARQFPYLDMNQPRPVTIFPENAKGDA